MSVVKMKMLCWALGITMKDGLKNKFVYNKLGVTYIIDKLRKKARSFSTRRS